MAGLLFTLPANGTAATTAPKLLRALKVKPERNAGYERDYFADWLDADSNGCDTRQEVLFRQNKDQKKSCADERGEWFSVYDGQRFTNSSALDVDHLAPLAEAWGSGAQRWGRNARSNYSNVLYRQSLLAVSASANRSKGDSDPAEWMPPRRSYHCRYLTLWVATKFRWSLSVDRRERNSIARGLSGCSSSKTTIESVEVARSVGR